MPRPRAEPVAPPGLDGGRGRVVLAVAATAVLLAAADTYVVVLALPDMMLGVGLGLDELQRATPIVSAFLLGYVATLPLVGRVADLVGRVPVLVGCLLLFALGSLLTATADELGLVVVGRALQGVGGGGLVPATIALVADLWPAERRGTPLGAVGAVQETGSVIGPLYGGLVLALAGWRAIFWVNLVGALALAVALRRLEPSRPSTRSRRWWPAGVAAAVAVAGLLLVVLRPRGLREDVTWGRLYDPLAGDSGWTSPLALATVVAAVVAAAAATPWARVRRLTKEADALGSLLLAAALAGVVLSFAAADPARAAVADSAPWLLAGSLLLLAGFAVRQRTGATPLLPRGAFGAPAAWGTLLVNFFLGVALVAALVDIPVFARTTTYPDSHLGATLVLLQLLVAMPVGALIGGWASNRVPPRVVAATGMVLAAGGLAAMATWDADALSGPASSVALVVAGLGFGLDDAPLNAALLAVTRRAVHGLAASLVVVAKMVGMLVGLSVLTAVGLRVFYAEQARIGTPIDLCPDSPASCPAYDAATQAAVVQELNAIFTGAAVSSLVAAVLAALLLRPPVRRTSP